MNDSVMLSMSIILLSAGSILAQQGTFSDNGIKNCTQCKLPDCYCKYKENPASLKNVAKPWPQIILLMYSGKVTEDVTEKLTEIFYKSKLQNPNGCGIGLTLFVDGVDTDYCEVHKLYSLGWEVSSRGNTSSATPTWNTTVWETNTDGHRQEMIEKARMKVDDVIGFRTPDHRTEANHFKTLWENGFTYDSSLTVSEQKVPAGDSSKWTLIQPWPFTLDLQLVDMDLTRVTGDPQAKYPGLWEVPLTRMRHNGTSRTCDYLHTCLGGLSKSHQLTKLLQYNLDRNKESNHAPLQINLRERDLFNTRLMKGLNDFLLWALHGEHTDYWVMSVDQLLRWMQTPASSKEMIEGVGADDLCTNRRKYYSCGKAKERRQRLANPFREVIDVDNLWIYQSVVLFVSYLIVKQYDKRHQA